MSGLDCLMSGLDCLICGELGGQTGSSGDALLPLSSEYDCLMSGLDCLIPVLDCLICP